MTRKFLLGAAICCAAVATDSYASLLVDINDVSNDTPEVTQVDFTGVTWNGLTGIVAPDVGTVDVSFAPIVGTPINDRDRGALNEAQPLGGLLRDFMFLNATLPDRGTIDATVSGINSGTYLFTGYFHDSNVNHGLGDIQISVDGGATFPIERQDALYSTTSNPSTVGRTSLEFTADGFNSVVIRDIGDGGTPGTTLMSETALLSGFVIEPFTELGDFNRAGGVTTADFFLLSDNLDERADTAWIGHAGGDINLDGSVDLDDFGQFKALFPEVVAAALGVPEPSSVMLALLAGLGGAIAYRRKRPR